MGEQYPMNVPEARKFSEQSVRTHISDVGVYQLRKLEVEKAKENRRAIRTGGRLALKTAGVRHTDEDILNQMATEADKTLAEKKQALVDSESLIRGHDSDAASVVADNLDAFQVAAMEDARADGVEVNPQLSPDHPPMVRQIESAPTIKL